MTIRTIWLLLCCLLTASCTITHKVRNLNNLPFEDSKVQTVKLEDLLSQLQIAVEYVNAYLVTEKNNDIQFSLGTISLSNVREANNEMNVDILINAGFTMDKVKTNTLTINVKPAIPKNTILALTHKNESEFDDAFRLFIRNIETLKTTNTQFVETGIMAGRQIVSALGSVAQSSFDLQDLTLVAKLKSLTSVTGGIGLSLGDYPGFKAQSTYTKTLEDSLMLTFKEIRPEPSE